MTIDGHGRRLHPTLDAIGGSCMGASSGAQKSTFASMHSPRKHSYLKFVLLLSLVLLSETRATAFISPSIRPSSRHQCGRRRQHNAFPKQREAGIYYPSTIGGPCTRRTFESALHASVSDDDTTTTASTTEAADRNLGILVLLTVPLAWGTFEPAVRFVYAIEPAVPGFFFSFGYYLVAAVALSTLAGLSSVMRQDETSESTTESNDGDDKNGALPIVGGIELGTYLFLGNGLQVLGLKTVASDRAAFLLQLTTVSSFS